MEGQIVRMLEHEIEAAIREIIARHRKPPGLPLLPSQRTIHLMAKTAVAVYECAFENQSERQGGNEE